MTDPLGVGLVGAGMWGRRVAADAATELTLETGATEGIAALRVILGCMTSAEEGRTVRLEEEIHADRRSG
jgi:hypothetical protein